MGKVIFDVSMSLDGFITGANVRPEAGLGDGGERLHEWAFNNQSPRNLEIIEELMKAGATISGRTTYDLSIQYWGADGPTGSARMPTVVVSHSVPKDVPEGSVYTFVNGVEAAVEAAKKLAGDKDVSISGANVAQQMLTRGLIDEIFVHVVPVLFGSGTRLFEGLGNEHTPLETVKVVETPEVIHLHFRVVKDKVSKDKA
jgi:dihydrofolate reductase